MRNWPALLLAPTLALTNLSITYALVTPACARRTMAAPNVVTAVVLIACAWMSWGAWRNWKDGRGAAARDHVPDRPPFVALVSSMAGALSCLAVLAQWFPQWVLSPCAN
jgi:hypothetical protein